MHGHRWPTLHTAMRVLRGADSSHGQGGVEPDVEAWPAATDVKLSAAVLTFAFSAVSIAYAAGRYTTRDDSIGGSCAQPLPTCVWARDG